MNRFLRDLLTMGRALFPSMAMFFDQLDTSPSEYVHNVVYEWGFFPGFSVREYFRGLLKKYLPAAYQRVHGRSLPGRTVPEIVGFEDFRAYTGVDFKVFGTNVARQEAHLFSADDTPTFPVAEAVGLSMSLPIIYKPVFVSGFGDGVDGVYVDGGLLNNLPLHAFDQAGSERDPTQDPVSTLPPGMLGLRLSSSGEANLQLAPPQPLAAGDVSFDGLITSASLLFGYLQSFCGTVLSPSEHGQFRSPIEQRQTIDLVCDMLSTLDFLPDQADIEAAIEISKAAVNAYFDVG
jgi:NTE family protein